MQLRQKTRKSLRMHFERKIKLKEMFYPIYDIFKKKDDITQTFVISSFFSLDYRRKRASAFLYVFSARSIRISE